MWCSGSTCLPPHDNEPIKLAVAAAVLFFRLRPVSPSGQWRNFRAPLDDRPPNSHCAACRRRLLVIRIPGAAHADSPDGRKENGRPYIHNTPHVVCNASIDLRSCGSDTMKKLHWSTCSVQERTFHRSPGCRFLDCANTQLPQLRRSAVFRITTRIPPAGHYQLILFFAVYLQVAGGRK
jgi:hypothetical protein